MAGFLPDELRERIRAANDIVDVIGGYLPLKRAGATFKALCPFHKEKTPSFNVDPQKQFFHCFGCQKGGDVFRFVQEYESIGFMDAVRRLADRAKIPIELDSNPGAQEARHIKDQLLQIHEQIAQRWQNCLLNEAAGQLARDYLAKRGVAAESIQFFRLGAAPDSWEDTLNWARSKNFDLAVMEKAGLIVRREGAEGHYDRFRGRLMFPICDEPGRVIGFSGRILTGDDKTAKYVNSPETPIFTKSKVFFGLDKTKRAILEAGFAIVCEGQLDLIASFTAGVQNIVAPQGTAFTEQHARILKRYVDEVVLCFDSDNAGQNAAVRSLDSLLASGLAVRVAVVPAPHDPDSFIKGNGAAAFSALISGAKGFFDYYLDQLCAANDLATDKGRLAVLRAMAEAVNKTGNEVLIDKHAQKTALRLGVTSQAVRTEFKSAHARRPIARQEVDVVDELGEPPVEKTPPSLHELWLLKLVLKHEAGLTWLHAHLDPAWVQHQDVADIITRYLTAHADGSWQSFGAFLDGFESSEVRGLITQAASEERAIPNPDQQMADIALLLRNQFLQKQLTLLDKRLNELNANDPEHLELAQQRQELKRYQRQPLAPLGDAH